MSDIAKWLESLGLGKYAKVFAENEIDFEILPHLTDEDLKDIGLPLGPRKKLSLAISARRAEQPDTAVAAPEPTTLTTLQSEAERRQLTVMFCDLVGSTELSRRLDPEDLREVVTACQDVWKAVIERYAGYVARYMGDGILAHFGYPIAHEDDAERAVRAGLAALDGAAALSERFAELDGVEIAARVGIATGLVVVGDLIGEAPLEERAVVGETPNLAARLQGVADPNTVVIAAGTRRLVEGRFELADLGPQMLKGIDEPVHAWRVDGESEAARRFDAGASEGLLSLVGREEEVRLLLRRWEQAKEGDTQVVLLEGEAGIGKSRVLRAAQDRIRLEPHNRILYFGSPYHQASAFHPIIGQLGRALRFGRDDPPAAKLDKLDAVLRELGLNVENHAPYITALLGLPEDGRYPPHGLDSDKLKGRTLEALTEMVRAMTEQRPVLLVVEDAHWLDASTGEFVAQLIDRLGSARLLCVLTFRPEGEPGWAPQAGATRLALSRLTRRQSIEMVRKVASDGDLPEVVVDAIVDKTDGVPLFVEELTKAVLEASSTGPGWIETLSIPATLQDSLTARLDHLGPAKDTAQLAAVFGREFLLEWLEAVSPLDSAEHERQLEALVDAGLVYRQSVVPQIVYAFKHALIQEAAYHSMLVARRREHHRAIAEALETRFPQVGETEPAILARHHEEAGAAGRAVPYLERAGKQALARWAYREAASYAARGLTLLGRIEDPAAREPAELGLRLVEAEANWRNGELQVALDAYGRAAEIALSIGDRERLVRAAVGFEHTEFHAARPAHATVRLAERALAVIPESDIAARSRLLASLARALASTGEFERAQTLCEEAIGMARGVNQPDALFDALNMRFYLWQGPATIDDRIATFDQMVRIAEEMNDRSRLLHAQSWRFFMALERGDLEGFERWRKAFAALADELHQPIFLWLKAGGEVVGALLAGRFEEAERLANDALRMGSGLQEIDVSGQYGVQMFTIRREQGRLEEVAPVIQRFVEMHPQSAAWRPGLALIYAELNQREAAREAFEALASDGFEGISRDAIFPLALAYLSEVCAYLSDAERAEQLYGLLLPYAGYTISVGVAVVSYGSADRYLGLLATTRGDLDAAERHFEQALEMNTALRARPWLAHTECRYAEMLLARNGPGDAARAARLLESALATARELGMRALERCIRALGPDVRGGPRMVT